MTTLAEHKYPVEGPQLELRPRSAAMAGKRYPWRKLNGVNVAKYCRRAQHAVPLQLQSKSGAIGLPITPLYFRQTSIQSLEWVPRIYYRNFLRETAANSIRAPIPLRSSIEAGADEVKKKNFRAIVALKIPT